MVNYLIVNVHIKSFASKALSKFELNLAKLRVKSSSWKTFTHLGWAPNYLLAAPEVIGGVKT